MRIPELRPFKMQDAREIQRSKNVDSFEPFDFKGTAFTFFIDNTPMACFGYDDDFIAWMIFSPEAKKYPRVAWGIKEMVNDAMKLVPYLVTIVREDWPEAQRFAQWAGFSKWHGDYLVRGIKYNRYVRFSHSIHSARVK